MQKPNITIVSSKSTYSFKHISVIEEELRFDDGRYGKHATVLHSGAVVILPLTADRKVLFVKQYRHSIGKSILELPAGCLGDKEDPRECAGRELQEEVGFNARNFISLGIVYPAPGFCSEQQHLFLATELFESRLPADDDEDITVEALTISEVFDLIRSNQLEDSKSIVAVTKAQLMGFI